MMTEQQAVVNDGNVELIKAFEMMWGSFPEPVMLIHRSRTILATNAVCQQLGAVPGTKCNAVQPEKHAGCKANQALDTNRPAPPATKPEQLRSPAIGFR